MSQRHIDIAERVVNLCEGKNTTMVIDCGCGKANTVKLLFNHGFCNVIGYDIDPSRGQHFVGSMDIVKFGDILNLPVLDEVADIVICSEVLEHLNSKDCFRALEELYRITQPKGYIIITTPKDERCVTKNPDHVRLVSFEELKNFFRNCELIENSVNYKNEKCRKRDWGSLFVIFRKFEGN